MESQLLVFQDSTPKTFVTLLLTLHNAYDNFADVVSNNAFLSHLN